MNGNNKNDGGFDADAHVQAPQRSGVLSRLRLQRTVIRTLSGAELQRVAGGACGGGSAVPPPDPPPPPSNTRCVGTVTK